METWRGAIVNGCIVLSGLIQEKELVQVGDKQLPQRQIGITPGGLYVYHRQRLPQGYTQPATNPIEGDPVWLVTPLGGGRNTIVGAQAILPNENTKDLESDSGREFLLESDSRATPGTVVLSDGGAFLGIVKKNKGSLAVCESAVSILMYLQGTITTPPSPGNPTAGTVWLHDHKAGKHWKGTIVRGVLVAEPSLLDQDLTKLEISSGSRIGDKLTKRHAVKVLDDRLALIWCDEVKPGYGLRDYRSRIGKDEFAFTDQVNLPSGEISPQRDLRVRTSGFSGGHAFASRVTDVRDKEIDLEWYRDNAKIGTAVFDPGWHLLGFNVAKSAEERAKLKSPNASSVVMASEVFRAIDEESRKLPIEKPTERENPKTESSSPEVPK